MQEKFKMLVWYVIRFVHVWICYLVISYPNIRSIQWCVDKKKNDEQLWEQMQNANISFKSTNFSPVLFHRVAWTPFFSIHLPMSIFLFYGKFTRKKHNGKWDKQLEFRIWTFTVNKTKVQFQRWNACQRKCFFLFFCFLTQYSQFLLKFAMKRGDYYFYSSNNNETRTIIICGRVVGDTTRYWLKEREKTLWNRSKNPIKYRLFFAWIAIKSWMYILSFYLFTQYFRGFHYTFTRVKLIAKGQRYYAIHFVNSWNEKKTSWNVPFPV